MCMKREIFMKKGGYLLKNQLNPIFKNIKYYDEFIEYNECLEYVYEKLKDKGIDQDSIFFNQFKWRLLDYYRKVCNPIKLERSFNSYYTFLSLEYDFDEFDMNILLYTIDRNFKKFIIFEEYLHRSDGRSIDTNYFVTHYKRIIKKQGWGINPIKSEVKDFLKLRFTELNYNHNMIKASCSYEDKDLAIGYTDEDGFWKSI